MASSLNLDTQTFNPTMQKFGAPASCIQNYQYWSVILRPAQVTLGALVLAAFEPVKAFSDLSNESFAELKVVTSDLENCLKKAFSCEKLNYLMLMMVDPDVHFHVIPRYSSAKVFASIEFTDTAWPGPPDLCRINQTDDVVNKHIVDFLNANWRQ